MSIRDILNDDGAYARDGGGFYDFSGAAVSTPHPSFMASLALTSPVSSSLSPTIPAKRSSSVNSQYMEEVAGRKYISRGVDDMAELLFRCDRTYLGNNIRSLSVGELLHPCIMDLWIKLVVNPSSPDIILLQTGFMNDDVYTQRIASGGVFYPTMGRDTILAPIQHPRTGHWVLVVCSMREMRVQIFDIMNHSDRGELIYEPFKAWLKKVHVMEDGTEWVNSDELKFSRNFNIASGMSSDDFAKAHFKKNSGIFTCIFMFYIYRRLEMFEFKPDDSLKARAWVIHKLQRAIISSFF
jgi:hypothetical protein